MARLGGFARSRIGSPRRSDRFGLRLFAAPRLPVVRPAADLAGAARRPSGRGWRQAWRLRASNSDARGGGSESIVGDETRGVKLTRVEAVLFLAREPITSRKLAQFAGLADGTEARTLIRQLNRRYDDDRTAFRAEELAGGFQLLTRARFGDWVRRSRRHGVETRLSPPALETLAVVAYRQPAPRADIEAVRGVDCGEILRQLMDRDFVRMVGRSTDLGRPYLYGTTKRFLQHFGLRHLDDLPRAGDLRAQARTLPTADVHTTIAGAAPEAPLNHFTAGADLATASDLAAIDLDRRGSAPNPESHREDRTA